MSQHKCTSTRNTVLAKYLSSDTRVLLYSVLCFLALGGLFTWWAVNPSLQIAVLQQEDPESDREDPETQTMDQLSLLWVISVSMDLPSGRALQTAGFMAVLGLWYRHRGRSLVFEDDWNCFVVLWANPDLGADGISQPLFPSGSQSRVVFLPLKRLFFVFRVFLSWWV